MQVKPFLQVGLLLLLATPLVAVSPDVSSSTYTLTSSWRSVANNAFAAGEVYNFVVIWGIKTVGNSSLSVQAIERLSGRPAYHIVAEASSTGIVDSFYHVQDRNEAWLDVQSLLTLRYEKNIHEGKYRIEETGNLDQVLHRYTEHAYRIDKNLYEDKQGNLTLDVMDVLGSLYYVRALPMAVGQSYSIDVFSGEKVWPLIVKIRKREKVKVPAGKFDCFLVQPILRQSGIFIAKGKKLEVWMTADARHMPVRMRSEVFIGHVAADLVSYKNSDITP